MLISCFATKMEDDSKRNRPEQTIGTPKHQRTLHFELLTADGKVTDKEKVVCRLKATVLLNDDIA